MNLTRRADSRRFDHHSNLATTCPRTQLTAEQLASRWLQWAALVELPAGFAAVVRAVEEPPSTTCQSVCSHLTHVAPLYCTFQPLTVSVVLPVFDPFSSIMTSTRCRCCSRSGGVSAVDAFHEEADVTQPSPGESAQCACATGKIWAVPASCPFGRFPPPRVEAWLAPA